MRKRLLLYAIVALAALSMGVTSCNKDDDDDDDPTVATYTSASTAITAFSLVENEDILANLDSVHFTIDLAGARIYNADSLPCGTDISRMLVQLSYPSCHSVQVAIRDAQRMNDTTFTYSNSDTIDFTGRVTITVTALDAVTTRTYAAQVNVHTLVSDSLQWGEVAYSTLPSAYGQVTEQKTVDYRGDVYCLMADHGYYVLASADSPADEWNKQALELPFTPDVRSFAAGADALYILDAAHSDLYSSTDGLTWTSCGVAWEQIIGAYDEMVLGLIYDGTAYYLDQYPRRAGYEPVAAPDGFPVDGRSNLVHYQNTWGTSNVSVCMGGVTASGDYVGRSWGFDGNSWSVLSNNQIQGREGMSMLMYTTYETSTTSWDYEAFPTLIAWGGRTADGEQDNSIYISRDMGMNWAAADTVMHLPSYIPAMYRADAVIYNTTFTATRAAGGNTLSWREMPSLPMPMWYNSATPVAVATRAASSDGVAPVTEWEVPYIYVFGGIDPQGNTHNTVWRGVLNRLTYKPLQ